MGREHIRTKEAPYTAGPERIVVASTGVRIYAAEQTQAREALPRDRMKRWPMGTWQSLGNVFSQLITGNPMNVWTNAVVAVVRVSEDKAWIVASHMPEMDTKHAKPYSGIGIVVRIPGRFERLGRVTVSLLSPPWSTTGIRQPKAGRD